MKVRGQSALDYLMSWGWVLIVIAAALIVLYSLGIFSVSSSPTIISGFPTVSVSGAVANSSLMIFKLVNNFGSTINLSNIAVSVNGKNYSSLDCEKTILPQGQTSLCRVPVSITSGKYLASVAINFLPYRSVVQLTSNGTVSASLYKGALALNNVNTLFYAYNAPVGQTWSVSFGGVLKSETISPSAAGHILNFSMPFGTYNYNVSNLSSSCSGAFPVPSKGTVSAGALYKIGYSGNCVTTFIESGIPSPFNWEVNYSDPLSRTAPAGSSISFLVPVNTTSVYRAVPLSLACANTSNVAIPAGGTVHISYWECNTTLSESGIPLGATGNGISGTLGWTASFNGTAASTNFPQSSSLTKSNNVTISSDTTLTGNLIVGGNLTIGPNVQLTTNGYMILVGGTLTFDSGASINTGAVPSQNFSSSYSGSGGGGGCSYESSLAYKGYNGYSTLVPGGVGSSCSSPAGNGTTPSFPSLNSTTISNLLSLAPYKLSGATGGDSGMSYTAGGAGAYGLYVQASNIVSEDIFNGAYVININAGGRAGVSGSSYTKNGITHNFGGGGGGGGGIVIFATRSSENFVGSDIVTSGGAGGSSGGGSSSAGGSGGGGGFYTYQYSTPPIPISSFIIKQTVSTISAQTASATVNGLSCQASNLLYEGSSNTFNSWHCNTTLSQNGLLTKNDVTISSDTTLTGNLIVGGNLTIGPNVQLTTNGYMILVGGTLTFALGASINTGTAPGGQNFSSSYGGSGGGSGNSAVGSTELSGTNGYSTLALGGSGGYGPGGNGATPAFPSLNPSTLINLLSLGDVAAFSGAGGGTSCNNCNGYGQGGPGAYGLYIQASNIISDDIFNGAYVININAGGSAGGSGGSYTKNGVTYNIGGGGGGGGGIVIFATRSSENIASNYIITSGGAGGLSGGGSSNAGGSGGGGGFYTYQYSTPPVQIPVGNWSASNNGAQISVNTSTPLVFTDDTFSNIAPTSFSVHSDSLACANTTSVYSGGSSTVSLWNCTDQYTEEGLPSGGTWNVSFSGKSYMASTGTPIKISSALVTTTYATTGFRTANAQSDNLDCHDNGIFQIFQGSNSTVNPWYCVTSFSESGIDFNAVGWTVYFNNNNIFSTSYQSSGSVNQTGIVTVSPEPMYSDVNGLNCHSADTFQVTPGSSAPQFNSWTCITTFSGFPGQFTFSYPNLPPQSFESTIYPTNTKVVNAYSLSTTSSTLTVSSTNSVVGPSVYMTGSVAPHSNATSISYTYQSQANTNSGSSYSFTANGSTAIFAVSVGVPYYNDVVTIGLPSGCSELSYEYNSMAQNEGTNHDVVFNQVNECNTTPGDTYTFTVSNSGSNGEVVAAGFVSYPFNPSYYHFAYNPTNSDHPSNSASPLDCTTEQTNWTFSTQTSSGVPGMFVGAVASGGQTPISTNSCESAYFSASQMVHSKDSANYEGDISWAAFLTQSYIPNTLWSYISDQNENLISPDGFAWGTAASMVSALAMPENLTSVHSDIGTTTSAFNISAGGTVNVAYTPWGYSAFS